jgi:pimeloyl-ACP methyl ester carboxylesterase
MRQDAAAPGTRRAVSALRYMCRMRENDVDTGRVRLSVRDHAGGTPAVLCLHGLASNARWWDLVAGRLAPRRRVVAVDQRGHGRSERPDGGYGFDEVVADVEALQAALGLSGVVLAGHSWGAWVALCHAAAAAPGVVAGVVCVDGGTGDLRAVFGSTWEEAEVAMTPPDLDGVTVEELRSWVATGPLGQGSDPDTGTRILLGNFEETGDGGLRPRLSRGRHMRIARALYELDTEELLSHLPVPCLLLLAAPHGRPIPPRLAAAQRALAALDGGGELRWIEGGHDLPVQRPAEVAAAIATFADRVAPLGRRTATES